MKVRNHSLKKPKILITGVTGFIGRHLANYLSEEQWEVHGLIRQSNSTRDLSNYSSSVKFHDTTGDLSSLVHVLNSTHPQLIIHLACHFVSNHRPEDIHNLIQSNIVFGTNLLEAAKLCGVKNFLNAGTDWQHYEGREYSPYSLYAATKQAFVDILKYYAEVCSIAAITLELTDTYGPDDTRARLLTVIRRAAFSGETLELSKGEQWLDLVHVQDVVKGIKIASQMLLEKNTNSQSVTFESYRLSGTDPLTLRDFIDLYSKITNTPIKTLWGIKPYRPRERWSISPHGEALPNWKPLVAIRDGIKEFHDYLKDR